QKESQSLSKSVTVDLKELFTPFVVTQAVETTLSATKDVKSVKRLQFESNADKNRFEPKRVELNADDLTVTLNPMEIRTFIITTKPR
ncbi:unnamed protein product, partial [Medioppia subpectinata]